MVLSIENNNPPQTIQTMPRTATGQAAKERRLRWCASSH
jgi:hypothetical protein